MTEIHWVEATTLEELWEGEILDVEIEGEPVLLVHLLGGEVKAYQGVCPHQEISLADGDWDEEHAVLMCVGHNWEFDLTSGVGINPAGCRLYSYPVQTEGDAVRVGIPQDGVRHYNRWPAT
ncbi:Rieske 2Fe-2S domain-containing protein [Pseudonocardia acidicola]|uniref:Rieske 2Fe-2S domain-containing protein n=1 Tax=Pseudonocardia acidicola TaxID=2724939 RepID=A0ABX1S6F3_9PSEU|nr:Rieske 2Fe-2S domain-containing protein [Pseudonocardia acidicola]